MKPSEQLRAAASLIDTPEKWIQNEFAKDRYGDSLVASELTQAVCFCAVGAVAAVMRSLYSDAVGSDAISFLRRLVGHVQPWNDVPGRTHAEVLDAFEKAALLAESEGQ